MNKNTFIKMFLPILILIIVFVFPFPIPIAKSLYLDESTLLRYTRIGGIEGYTSLQISQKGQVQYRFSQRDIYSTSLSADELERLTRFINGKQFSTIRTSLLKGFIDLITNRIRWCMDCASESYLVNYKRGTFTVKGDKLLSDIISKIETEALTKFGEKETRPQAIICPTPHYVSPQCPKVITKAKNIKTGEVKEFSDGCLPLCWVETK